VVYLDRDGPVSTISFEITPLAGKETSGVVTVAVDGDIIHAGDGDNIVFGDNGRITAAASDAVPSMTLGLVETVESLIGGSDRIHTGVGNDIVLGGIDADVIDASHGNNIVLGDNGFIDWVAGEASRGYALQAPGDDTDPEDVDRIWTSAPNHGGNDVITTGDGDDIIIGGEDGEIVVDNEIGFATPTSLPRIVVGDVADGDTIMAGDGRNVVLGDNGRITGASDDDQPNFGGQPITFGLVETIEPLIGGSDTITTGADDDIVLGGIDADTIDAGHGNNIVLGDSGYVDWTAAESSAPAFALAAVPAAAATAGDDLDPSDIDRIWASDTDYGGNDVITTGNGDDIIFGGEDGEIVTDVSIEGEPSVLHFASTTAIAFGTVDAPDPVDGEVWTRLAQSRSPSRSAIRTTSDPATDTLVSTPITTLAHVAGALATAINEPGTGFRAKLEGQSTLVVVGIDGAASDQFDIQVSVAPTL
jgi:Ca2+-binding RTX toxin-like protein